MLYMCYCHGANVSLVMGLRIHCNSVEKHTTLYQQDTTVQWAIYHMKHVAMMQVTHIHPNPNQAFISVPYKCPMKKLGSGPYQEGL